MDHDRGAPPRGGLRRPRRGPGRRGGRDRRDALRRRRRVSDRSVEPRPAHVWSGGLSARRRGAEPPSRRPLPMPVRRARRCGPAVRGGRPEPFRTLR
ncbi:hypothetical protein FXF69_25480 [Actinomadura chibensis]|uniref:Uncharacterized protein n=1 Tax=Actinomadura chibensis TaxID=392828 RepID=A0A5D0NIW6_9ACTN|nr:hypothetical protein FXF69_25480 [Actinomadura chibensis]